MRFPLCARKRRGVAAEEMRKGRKPKTEHLDLKPVIACVQTNNGRESARKVRGRAAEGDLSREVIWHNPQICLHPGSWPLRLFCLSALFSRGIVWVCVNLICFMWESQGTSLLIW